MTDATTTRRRVSETYAAAVSKPALEGCCGDQSTKGVAAALADYQDSDLDQLPADAVVNSFGCGNPVDFAGVEPGDVVLDLGSGAGIDILLAARKVGPTGNVIGVDMTDEMIARAQGNIDASGMKNVEVRKGLIEELPVDDESVDWVISNCVINLSPEKHRVFAEISRVLKPGGHVVVSDLIAEDLPQQVLDSPALYDSCVAGAISEAEYISGLEDAGLTEVAIEARLVYSASQLRELVESDLSAAEPICCTPDGEIPTEAITQTAGRVWSARIRATKPG